MTKTLWCEAEERKSALEMPKYTKVTATKVDEIEEYKENLYKDDNGNYYITRRNEFQKRLEFVKVNM